MITNARAARNILTAWKEGVPLQRVG